MDALTLVGAFVVALFWALVSIFTPLLPKRSPPPPATRSHRQRRKTRSDSPKIATVELATSQPPSATSATLLVVESSSEASSVFSTAPSSISLDDEPLTPAASEEFATVTPCSPARPYRKFSEFKTTFTAPFAKRRSVTLDLPSTAPPARPSRERSRSTSRTRAPFVALFSSRSQSAATTLADDMPLTPDSMSSSAKSFMAPAPDRAAPRMAPKPRASLPLNLPPLSRLQQRRVSAPAAGPIASLCLPAAKVEPRPPLTPSPSESPASDAAPLPSRPTTPAPCTPSTSVPAEKERERGRRMSWARPFSKRANGEGKTKEKPEKPKMQKQRASSSCREASRASARESRPSVDADAVISDRTYESCSEASMPAPVRTRTWFERREERARRARSVDRDKRDRHSISALVAQEAWAPPSAPAVSVAPT